MRLYFFRTALGLGALAVALGAFGAHGLEDRFPERIDVWKTGALYHMFHALALLAFCAAPIDWTSRPPRAAGWCWVVGIALFSGSLYALTVTGVGALGMITPIGGVAQIAGWILAACSPWQAQRVVPSSSK